MKRQLSPKQIAEKAQRYRQAVIVLARQSARRTVKENIRAQGLKIAEFTASEISERAEVEFERDRARLIAEAEYLIEHWPGLAYLRCAELINGGEDCPTPKLA